MFLEEDDFIQFAKLHWALLNFVSQETDLFPDDWEDLNVLELEIEDKLDLFDVFYEKPAEFIDAYLAKYSDRLDVEEKEIVESWKSLRSGEFVIFRQLQKHAVVLGTGKDGAAYAVLGLTEPMADVVGNRLPATVETALFPFKGVVVFDGLMRSLPYGYTGYGKKMLNEQYKAAKAGAGIVTQLSPLGVPKHKPTAADRAKRLADKLRASLGTLRDTREQLRNFEENVEPPFRQWLTREHGDLQERFDSLEQEAYRLEEWLYQAQMSWRLREFRSKKQTLDAIERRMREEEEEQSRSDDAESDGEKSDGGDGGAGASSGSPMDDIPDSLVDTLLTEFLREMRGVDPSRLSAKEWEKAREDFFKSFDHVASGDRGAFEKSVLKIGADDSEKNRSAVKKVFRRLARSLHPDRNDDFGDEAKEIWEELQMRRDALDLESLELLEMKWRLLRGDSFSGRDEKRLKRLRERIRDEERDLDEEIYHRSDHPMWGKKPAEVPPKAVRKRAKEDLESAIADLEKEKARLEREIEAFAGGSPKKKRSPARKAAPRKSSPGQNKTKENAAPENPEPDTTENRQRTFDFG